MISVKIPLNSLFFSEIFWFSPKMTAKTTENDRENGSSGKRLRNEKERNGMIFHLFSSIFRIFSVCFPHKKAPDASRTEGSEILTKFPT